MGDVISHIINTFKYVFSQIINSKRQVKSAMFAVVGVAAILLSLSYTGARLAYKVRYSGKIIATVSHKDHFDKAIELIAEKVSGENVEQAIEKPRFDATLVTDDGISSEEQLADAIIENTEEIVSAAGLVIDGTKVGCARQEELEAYLEQYLNSFAPEGCQSSGRFAQSVTIESGYYMASEVSDVSSLADKISELNVITTAYQVSEVIVPYKSTTKKTNEKVVGYKNVTVTGVSGVNRVTQQVVLVNGVEQSRDDISTEVVSAPVNEVVLVGTASSAASAELKVAGHSAGFIFPLPSGTWQVSAYYGDGRNHKGIDIRAPKGTSIYAVKEGAVIYSGWRGDYGYCVEIDHGNGTTSLYAHASSLCCSVGDSVSAGQVIALVGTTGQSTGNHLHFEVKRNGKKVNPASYIGLD